ncbi:MAG TPA: RimK/LysX family protein [Bacteroidia bacterium]|jgi:hypothetical protein
MASKKKEKITIGRREHVDFPELGIFGLTAKIDTGAYTAALHCHDIVVRDGKLCFKLLDPTHPEYQEKEHTFGNYYEKDIKNSFGEIEKRYVIKTLVRIGKRRIKSVISLTNRGTMRYPVLIGRRMLKGKFIVDVSQLMIAK